jgi:hypothetical protein
VLGGLRRFFIGHELGHIANGEIGFLCIWNELYTMMRWWPAVVLWIHVLTWYLAPIPCHWFLVPSLVLLVTMTSLIQLLARSAGREREFSADAAGLYVITDPAVRTVLGSPANERCSNPLHRAFETLTYLQRHSPGAPTIRGLGWSLGAIPIAEEPKLLSGKSPPALKRLAGEIASAWTRTHPALGARQHFWEGQARWHAALPVLLRNASVFAAQLASLAALIGTVYCTRHLLNVLWLNTQSATWVISPSPVIIERLFNFAVYPLAVFLFATAFISCYEGSVTSPERREEEAAGLAVAAMLIAPLIVGVIIGIVLVPIYASILLIEPYLVAQGWDLLISKGLLQTGAVSTFLTTIGAYFSATAFASRSGIEWAAEAFPWLKRSEVRSCAAIVSLFCLPLLAWILAVIATGSVGGRLIPFVTAINEAVLLVGAAWQIAKHPVGARKLWKTLWPGSVV